MTKLKAVIFDIDGVLIDSVYANAVFFERLFKRVGIRYSKTEYIKLNHLTMWNIVKHFSKEKSETKIRKIWLQAKQSEYPFELVKVPKDSKQVVASLAKKYKLAVVTARVKNGVLPVLRRYGYNKYIKTTVAYEDYKYPKPHPEPLMKALGKLKIKPSEAVYVGDMPSDVQCASVAGVKSIFFSRRKNKKADYNVKSFKELRKLLENYAG
ncbi:MAG TPA: HAD-IA family hydrolase [Patescibacteria group bacterium]|jgi:pyrophosphatase PpaX|nr:HAD-IA family hydrolase [Patescibacteria group bacterium]